MKFFLIFMLKNQVGFKELLKDDGTLFISFIDYTGLNDSVHTVKASKSM